MATDPYIDPGYIDSGYFEEGVEPGAPSSSRQVEVPALGRLAEAPGSTRIAEVAALSRVFKVSGAGGGGVGLDENRSISPLVGDLRLVTLIAAGNQVSVTVLSNSVSIKKGDDMALLWSETFDPHEKKDYSVDFGELLDEVNDSIVSAVWTIDAAATTAGLLEDSSNIQNDKRVCVIWLDCTDGKEADLIALGTCNLDLLVTTVGGRIFNRTLQLTVESL